MSDTIKHECGIALLRLLKPLEYYQQKYGTPFYGLHKMYLLLEKQHNRGQDGAGLANIKLNMQPGERYIGRVRSNDSQPIQDIFKQINSHINELLKSHPEAKTDVQALKRLIPYLGEVYLGHVRYGTFGKNSIENVHPFLRENNWIYRNLILAGNFNLTNVNELFNKLVELGQHPIAKSDTITVMERIGHFLDNEVEECYRRLKQEGISKREASPLIMEQLDMVKVLKKAAARWDGGYAMAGIVGHGVSFVLRDPAAIRPAYYYKDDEVVVVTSERAVIQTAFDVPFEEVIELPAGAAILINRDGTSQIEQILEPVERKACSFERIYFSRGSDQEIYLERKKLGALLLPQVLHSIDNDLKNTVFSYIPNTAETSFYGLIEAVSEHLNQKKKQQILQEGTTLTEARLSEILSVRPRIEKVAIKDVKLRTFITEDSGREDMVAHVYDITYGSVKKHQDNLVIIDDSIVRGTTLKKSILNILNRLQPKKITVLSSAPQIRYPDCYGIDMARLEDLIAFEATLALHKDAGTYGVVEAIYQKCIAQKGKPDAEIINYVKELYAPFTPEQISQKITQLLRPEAMKCDLDIIFQSVENLHKACPKNLGDWYFTGDYPTVGGNRVVNQAFINFYEGNKQRAY
ncbi:class II glutamine amidotransferase [Capnocytophaga gingivalis]|uniref:Class II glutamine amidotransferase n=1 Tax=Capnocytophaga gingivalis TaxID=1017 RepID=A0ABU5Z750_9FLAO|nr:class II glutamine amidotransferase [Capnocytophaga gingivalis]MEB3074794.1 class II glutamine amidotransferase [Capnocytophaga gingivalis]